MESPLQTVYLPRRWLAFRHTSLGRLGITVALVCGFLPIGLRAQTAGPFTAPMTPVGTAAAQTPVYFTVSATVSLGTTQVLTRGATGLDFTLGTGSTCTGTLMAGQTCMVNVAFTPQYPGVRQGAVELTDGSGTVIATEFINGTGTGPLATLTPGIITTVAGNGSAANGSVQDGVPATSSAVGNPSGVALDGAGNLYIADPGNDRIRKVAVATGIITTVAGNGTRGYVASQDGGPATSAELFAPEGVVIDGAGNLYFGDGGNYRVRKVTAATGIITTVAGNGGYEYVASQDGGPATSAALDGLTTVGMDGAGNLYIATTYRIRKVTAATGIITTLAGNGSMDYDPSQDGGPATSASLYFPGSVSVDSAGNLYIADGGHDRIRKVTAATGIITTIAGNGSETYQPSQEGGPATSAALNFPGDAELDAAGDLYITDTYNERIRKVSATTGDIITIAGSNGYQYAASQDGSPATSAYLNEPEFTAIDSAGNLYVSDSSNNRIRRVSVQSDIQFPTATAAGTPDTADGTQTLTVNNLGNTALTFASQAETGSSFVLANPSNGGCIPNGMVAAGSSCFMGATFAPVSGSSGQVTGGVTLTDNSLNVSGAMQLFPLIGSIAVYSAVVDVAGTTATAGVSSATLEYIVGYSGTATDVGTVTVAVNGSSTGVGTPACVSKGGHENCTVAYTGTALTMAGNYNIVVSVAADTNDGYAASSGTGVLTVVASHAKPVTIARPEPLEKILNQGVTAQAAMQIP